AAALDYSGVEVAGRNGPVLPGRWRTPLDWSVADEVGGQVVQPLLGRRFLVGHRSPLRPGELVVHYSRRFIQRYPFLVMVEDKPILPANLRRIGRPGARRPRADPIRYGQQHFRNAHRSPPVGSIICRWGRIG